jgi:alanyl-tRNA synthetase
LPKEDNWWGPAGETGPCGPDTEMFYWKLNDTPAPEFFDGKDKNWVEIWNDVFMQYVKDKDGKYNLASQKNVDTGMGLERTLAVLNGKENSYETDLFLPIIEKIEELTGKKSSENKKSFRIVADHVKASTFLLSAGVEPSNLGRGYILRRLIRRAIRHGKQLGLKENFIVELYPEVVKIYNGFYSEIETKKDFILEQFKAEEEKFGRTLEKAEKEFELYWMKGPADVAGKSEEQVKEYFGKLPRKINGPAAFYFYQTYGLPIEMMKEMAKEKGMEVDEAGFYEELEKHQELSRTASAGVFKGGLADNSEQTTKLHTAAHLMLAGLRKVLGEGVTQKGSNITAERLRFDFAYDKKMTSGELADVENFVNGIINKDLPVKCEEMTIDKARELNAMGVFGEKYGEKVKVYTIGDGNEVASREICGGPHVEHTGVLGHFKIVKEESSSSGVRRIKAILE